MSHNLYTLRNSFSEAYMSYVRRRVASHLAHQHQSGRYGSLSTVLQLNDSSLVARDGYIRRKQKARE